MHSCFHGKTKHDRCFFWFLAAMLVPIWMGNNIASPYKSLYLWENHFSKYLAYEKLHWPESWQGSEDICLLAFPRLWSIYWTVLTFLFDGMTVKTSNYLKTVVNNLSRMNGHPWNMKKGGHNWSWPYMGL